MLLESPAPRWPRAANKSIACCMAMLAACVAGPVQAAAGKLNPLDYTGDVIYQIVTDRFFDGDPSNNPPAPQSSKDCTATELYCGGDWQGIIAKIEDGYLTGLGISAILISPAMENVDMVLEGRYSAYHGYWPRDLKRTNPAFGSKADFARLIEVAHAHGIKVLIDFIGNQTSPALEADPAFGENGRLLDDGKPLAAFSGDTHGMYHHYGETDYSGLEDQMHKSVLNLADLDQQQPAIDAYLKSAVKVWLDTGIDGIRVDTVKHIALGWQKSWMQTIYSHRPVFVAGEWYVGRGEVQNTSYDFANRSGMSVLDFPFAQAVRAVFRYQEQDMRALDRMIAETAQAYAQPLDQVIFIDNHDQGRFTLSGSAAHKRLVEQAVAFALTSRGTPMIYYGTEQYMEGDGHAPLNRAQMRSFDTGTPLYGMIGKLASLRKANPALQFGQQQRRWLSADAYVFERSFHGNSVLVAINRNASKAVEVSGMSASLPCNKGGYADVLGQAFGGTAITVRCGGAVAPFTLAPGAIAVWSAVSTGSAGKAPELGHVGPMLALPGQELSLSGRHFGKRAGSVRFGDVTVRGAGILHWDDQSIRLRVPPVAAGRYGITVVQGGHRSETYSKVEVLSGPQASVRFVVDDATAEPGEAVYLLGASEELGAGQPERALGPMFNKVVYHYPSWYLDANVAAGQSLSFRFIKKTAVGTAVALETGDAHRIIAPAAGTATVRVKLNGWAALQPGVSRPVTGVYQQ